MGAGGAVGTGGAVEEVDPEAAQGALAASKRAVESKEKAILTVMARREADLVKEKRALDIIRREMQVALSSVIKRRLATPRHEQSTCPPPLFNREFAKATKLSPPCRPQALTQQQSKEILDVMTRLGEVRSRLICSVLRQAFLDARFYFFKYPFPLGTCPQTDKDLWYLERDFKAAEAEYLKCKARFEKMRQAKTELAAELTSLTLNAEHKKEEKLNSIMEKLKADGVVFPGVRTTTLQNQQLMINLSMAIYLRHAPVGGVSWPR